MERFLRMEVSFLYPSTYVCNKQALMLFLLLFCLCITHNATAGERLTIFLEVAGDTPETEQLIFKNASAELAVLNNVQQVKKAELASIIVSFIARTPLPSSEKQGQLVVYSFAYGINEIGLQSNPPVSIPRFIAHDVRWSSWDQLAANIRGNIREVDQDFFSLIQ